MRGPFGEVAPVHFGGVGGFRRATAFPARGPFGEIASAHIGGVEWKLYGGIPRFPPKSSKIFHHSRRTSQRRYICVASTHAQKSPNPPKTKTKWSIAAASLRASQCSTIAHGITLDRIIIRKSRRRFIAAADGVLITNRKRKAAPRTFPTPVRRARRVAVQCHAAGANNARRNAASPDRGHRRAKLCRLFRRQPTRRQSRRPRRRRLRRSDFNSPLPFLFPCRQQRDARQARLPSAFPQRTLARRRPTRFHARIITFAPPTGGRRRGTRTGEKRPWARRARPGGLSAARFVKGERDGGRSPPAPLCPARSMRAGRPRSPFRRESSNPRRPWRRRPP